MTQARIMAMSHINTQNDNPLRRPSVYFMLLPLIFLLLLAFIDSSVSVALVQCVDERNNFSGWKKIHYFKYFD